MGCCNSSPYSQRRYVYDSEDKHATLRTFGTFRNNSNLIPDDIPGLPSTHRLYTLSSDANEILYEAEIDQGRAWDCFRPKFLLLLFPPFLIALAIYGGLAIVLRKLTCDEAICWIRKEYNTRSFFRVYYNRLVINTPKVRFWGCCGCGSWNADNVVTHPFDRGAFGFRTLGGGRSAYNMFCLWPVYGQTMARQRCPCNGSVWPRMFVDCNGWWCDEWICDMLFCTYKYNGLADADETAFAASIALQAYFETRTITKEDVDKCIEYWRENVSERTAPLERRRRACCEPFRLPIPTCRRLQEYVCHCKRTIPYKDEEKITEELEEAYKLYDEARLKQIDEYKTFYGPYRYNDLCKACGCRRLFGRRGLIFCTEGCDANICSYKKGDPAPPFSHPDDIDDANDASRILQTVLGDPPSLILIQRQEIDPESQTVVMTNHRGLVPQDRPSRREQYEALGGVVGKSGIVLKPVKEEERRKFLRGNRVAANRHLEVDLGV